MSTKNPEITRKDLNNFEEKKVFEKRLCLDINSKLHDEPGEFDHIQGTTDHQETILTEFRHKMRAGDLLGYFFSSNSGDELFSQG